jgi:hypothetical protein
MSLCLDILDLDSWGKRHRAMRCLKILRNYGGAAKPLLPRLREVESQLREHREQKALATHIEEISSLIDFIENAPTGEPLRPLR